MISLIWEATTATQMLPATELYPTKCTFQRYIQYIDIGGRYFARVYDRNTVGKNGNFQPLYMKIPHKW